MQGVDVTTSNTTLHSFSHLDLRNFRTVVEEIGGPRGRSVELRRHSTGWPQRDVMKDKIIGTRIDPRISAGRRSCRQRGSNGGMGRMGSLPTLLDFVAWRLLAPTAP